MVNLLLTGRAVSNVFDGTICLGDGADKTLLKEGRIIDSAENLEEINKHRTSSL
jgi:hypothetical protein